MAKASFTGALAALGRPLLWRWMSSPNSGLPQAMLPFLHSSGEDVSLTLLEGAMGVLVLADAAGDKRLIRRRLPWSNSMTRRFTAKPEGLVLIAFEGGVLITWASKIAQRYALEDVAEVPNWSSDSAYRESRFARRFPLSPAGVRFSSKVADSLALTPGTPLYLHRFAMWGSYGYVLSTLSSTGGHAVDAWDGATLRLKLDWLKPLAPNQSVIHVMGMPGTGLVVLPSRSSIARPIAAPVMPSLAGFQVIGRRQQSVIPFRQGLRCIEVPGAILQAAGFHVGDSLQVERLPGEHGLVLRKDSSGKQRVRFCGASPAFRLGSTSLNWCGARDSVQSIACEGAVVVVDGQLGLDIPVLPIQQGSTTAPNRTYPRPEGRLQLGGAWLKEQGFEPGMNYRMEFHKRGLLLVVDPEGPYQVTAQNPGSEVPKAYVPGDFLSTLRVDAPEIGILLIGPGRLLIVPRGKSRARATHTSLGHSLARLKRCPGGPDRLSAQL